MADLILSQNGNQKLIYVGGQVYWEGPAAGPATLPSANPVVRVLVDAYRYRFPPLSQESVPSGGWLALASLVVLAMAAFYTTASRGCTARNVNRILAALTGAMLLQNIPQMNAAITTLLTCLVRGLSTIPAGALAFAQTNAFEYREPTGGILQTRAVASGTYIFGAQMLDSGSVALDCLTVTAAVRVFAPNGGLVSVVLATSTQPPFQSVASSGTAFYVGRVLFTDPNYQSTIYQVSEAGAVVQTVNLPVGYILRVFGVSWDGQTFYYSDGSDNVYGIVGLSDGTVVKLVHNGASLPTGNPGASSVLKVYNANGVLLNTWGPFAAPAYLAEVLTRGTDDTEDNASVWVWLGTQVSEIRVVDGVVLNSFPISNTPGPGESLSGLFEVRKTIG